MSLTVKVYFERTNGSNEIRRFLLNDTAGSDIFKVVKDKICHLFPTLTNSRDFILHWQDPDGDRVAFSTSEEMKDAMTYVSDGVLRVYISENSISLDTTDKRKQQQNPSSDKQLKFQYSNESQAPGFRCNSNHASCNGGYTHSGVTCSVCQCQITGIIYKCCVCPEYYLCQTCESKGLHAEHNMFRINYSHFVFPPPSNFMFDKCRSCMTSGVNASPSSCGHCASGGADIHTEANPNRNAKKERVSFEEHVHDFGTNMFAFLDPFGLNVGYNINDGNHPYERCPYNWWRMREKCPAWDHMYRRAHQSMAPDCSHPVTTEKVDVDSRNCTSRNIDAQNIKEYVNKTESGNDSPTCDWAFCQENGCQLRIPTTFAIPMPGPTSAPVSVVPLASQQSEAVPPPPASTTTHAPSAGITSSSRSYATHQSSDNSGSSSIETPVVIPHNICHNLQIQQSLDQMLAMGFTDTNGWLTSLLTENAGNISSTIDAIKKKATQQLKNVNDKH